MSKIIHINESTYDRVKPLPFLTFFEEVLKFIKGLLNDPIGTRPSELLKKYGFENGELRKKLLDYDIITKKENISEPFDEKNGKMVSKYSVSYKVPKENFKNKIRKLHTDEFSVNEAYVTSKGIKLHNNALGNNLRMRGEIDMMLNSPLTMGVISDENAPTYVKQAVDIYNKKINKL